MVALSQLVVCIVAFSIISVEACPLAGCDNQQARKKREVEATENGKFVDGSAVVSENADGKVEFSGDVTEQEQTTKIPTSTSEVVVESTTESFIEKKEEAVLNATMGEEIIEKSGNISEGFAEVNLNALESGEKKGDNINEGLAEKKAEISETERHEEVTVQSIAEKNQEVDDRKNETVIETRAEVKPEAGTEMKEETTAETVIEKKGDEAEVEKKEEATTETISEKKMEMEIEMKNETTSERINQESAMEVVNETAMERKEEHSESKSEKNEEVVTATEGEQSKTESKEKVEKTEMNAQRKTSSAQSASEAATNAEAHMSASGEEKNSHMEKIVIGEHESSGEEPASTSSVAPELETILKTDTDNILVTHFKGAASTCSSPELKALMHKALTDDIETSKSSLYDALHDYVPNGGFLIFCSEGRFSFKADAIEHCLVGNDKFNCYAFRA